MIDHPTRRLLQLRREELAQQHLALLGAERLAGGAILDELERHEVAGAAHVADDVVVAREAVQLLGEVGLVGAHVAEHVEALHDLEVRARDRGRERVAAERDAVQVVLAALDERLRHAIGDEQRHRRPGYR